MVLDYRYPARGAGVWQISGWASDPPDLQACCIPYVGEINRQRIIDPTLITVRRNSSLRLVRRLQSTHRGCREAIIDIAPGQANTLFHSRNPLLPPRWTADPAVQGSITLGVSRRTGWVKFAGDTYSGGPDPGKGYWLGPPQNGASGAFRLPGNQPGPCSLLGAVKINGGCIQTAWMRPGISTYMEVVGWDGERTTLEFENGILVSTSRSSFLCTPDASVTCCDSMPVDYDPCETLEPSGPEECCITGELSHTDRPPIQPIPDPPEDPVDPPDDRTSGGVDPPPPPPPTTTTTVTNTTLTEGQGSKPNPDGPPPVVPPPDNPQPPAQPPQNPQPPVNPQPPQQPQDPDPGLPPAQPPNPQPPTVDDLINTLTGLTGQQTGGLTRGNPPGPPPPTE